MPQSSKNLEAVELLGEVREALAALPGIRLHTERRHRCLLDRRVDLVITADIKGQPADILIDVKANAYPRDVRAAADQLLALRDRNRQQDGMRPLSLMLVAPAIPPTSRELLRERGVGYWDSGGSLYLDLPHALYWIDRPVPERSVRRARNVFRGRAAQVLHALLTAPERAWHVHELAERAEVAPSTVHQVFTFLEEHLWVEKRGAGPQVVRILHEPGALLDAWSEHHTLAAYSAHRFHRWARDPSEVRRIVTFVLETHGVEYALTLAAGASFVAPFATDSGRLTLLVPPLTILDTVTRQAGLSPVDEGETVTFLVTRERTPLLFRRRIDDTWVASDIQLYLDLYAWPQRGKEQARHLRAERLGF
ncbi:MAG: helix-turn-helix domain-containing protein [Chloroflexi bacterium]|nr:helix-turn-helix domain-containing protein [Chloroflexota bacterium]